MKSLAARLARLEAESCDQGLTVLVRKLSRGPELVELAGSGTRLLRDPGEAEDAFIARMALAVPLQPWGGRVLIGNP